MSLTTSVTLSNLSNTVVNGLQATPAASSWSFRLTLSFNGVVPTEVISLSTYSYLNINGANTIWDISNALGEPVFVGEKFRFVSYDDNFNAKITETNTAYEQPLNSSVFRYDPPTPSFERPTTFSFRVSYVEPGAEGMPGIATTEIVYVTVTFVWDPSIGLGQLREALNNSIY